MHTSVLPHPLVHETYREQNSFVTLHLDDVCGLNNLLLLLFKGKWLRSSPNLSQLENTTNFDKGFKMKNWSVPSPIRFSAWYCESFIDGFMGELTLTTNLFI